MSLESGNYWISCKVNDFPVGRYPVEDRGFFPKPVYALGNSTGPSLWAVEQCEEGYVLRNRGGRAAAIDGKLFAVIAEEDPVEPWVIQAQPHQGDNLYTIHTKDLSKGWAQKEEVAGKPDTFTIAVEVLPVRESFPPQYLPNSLFEFQRIVADIDV